MNAIEIMNHEHKNICRMLEVLRQMSIEVMNHKKVVDTDFRDAISFIREYADKYHHGKEENFLFNQMLEHMGTIGENLIRHGMLVEHDLGRAHVLELETALNAYQTEQTDALRLQIIAETMGYANLLQKHAEKEDAVVYPFAQRQLPSEVMEKIEEQVRQFESDERNQHSRDLNLQRLERLEKEYVTK